jgi:hypothetical protein
VLAHAPRQPQARQIFNVRQKMKNARRFCLLVCIVCLAVPAGFSTPHETNDGGFIKYSRPAGGHEFDPASEKQPLTVDYEKEQVGKILYDIASLYDLEITFPKSVSGMVISLKLEKVTYRFALEEIARKSNLKVIFGTGEALLK